MYPIVQYAACKETKLFISKQGTVLACYTQKYPKNFMSSLLAVLSHFSQGGESPPLLGILSLAFGL